MTYCVGFLVEGGLAMIADTRTNAGVDNVSTYRKLHRFDLGGGGFVTLATAGNLSVTQATLNLLREGIENADTGQVETLDEAPSLFRAARLVGQAVRKVRGDMAPSLEADSVSSDVALLLGGRVGDGPLGLYLVYSAGNFIECGPETPYLQIGETKYGKPVLDRAVTFRSPLWDVVKIGLVSFDSTLRSNLAVGLPLDLMVAPRTPAAPIVSRRIEADDLYFRDLVERWSSALKATLTAIPEPPYGE
ncbi:MAG: peptidase [Caulobacteraceae bacterium]|nr:peptidase [Caulobacteraceae bacterium]